MLDDESKLMFDFTLFYLWPRKMLNLKIDQILLYLLPAVFRCLDFPQSLHLQETQYYIYRTLEAILHLYCLIEILLHLIPILIIFLNMLFSLLLSVA